MSAATLAVNGFLLLSVLSLLGGIARALRARGPRRLALLAAACAWYALALFVVRLAWRGAAGGSW